VIGSLAREIETTHRQALPLPTATAHGTSAWVAENAAISATDDTFGLVTLNAFKAATKTIVSDELLADALPEFDAYLAAELGRGLDLARAHGAADYDSGDAGVDDMSALGRAVVSDPEAVLARIGAASASQCAGRVRVLARPARESEHGVHGCQVARERAFDHGPVGEEVRGRSGDDLRRWVEPRDHS
jgi:hypothetical protein